ncbi:MerR family transcriptional regulator [Sphingobium subterraneum]|uniref:DNA-binding transcriptional MerR regulator n=1 Tax=Sphingobium subterraneum TaxID=627688 RepID=A0A841IXD3_9SPHN|nr:MerR family transcriptional regulator [Sphingobium subterraneum]MBB6123323.1 DNA-binding transcriptional MerR regulator [Sphingobium subterraneum]
MAKQAGAFLTIGELSAELGVPQHVLRYWEGRFPQLRPLQRAGNRRYYRPEDVELVREIHRLLQIEGRTVKGAQLALAARDQAEVAPVLLAKTVQGSAQQTSVDLLQRLQAVRAVLAEALSDTD